MTQQTLTTSLLKHSQPLLAKCLQAALIAAPVMLAAAPSHAASVYGTVNGFTGAFAQENWTKTPGSTANSVSFFPTSPKIANTLTIVKNNNNTASPRAKIAINKDIIDALKPIKGFNFIGWEVTGKYTFAGSNLARFNFQGNSNTDSEILDKGSTPVQTPTAFIITGGQDTDGNISFDDELAFQINRVSAGTATGTGVISDFKFIAEYDVPGPLPIVGAAAAFAWSRKLRNRLKSANTLV